MSLRRGLCDPNIFDLGVGCGKLRGGSGGEGVDKRCNKKHGARG